MTVRTVLTRAMKLVLSAAVLLASISSLSQAQTITFNGLGEANGSAFSTYSEGGFTVDLFAGAICVAQNFGNPTPDLFGGVACNSTSSSTLRIRRDGGGTFNFLNTDLASNNGSSNFIFSGFVGASNIFTQSAPFAFGTGVFGNVSSSSQTANIDELRIALAPDANTTSYNIDNIALNASTTTSAPEPASIALFGTGLAALVGMGTLRRRRHNG